MRFLSLTAMCPCTRNWGFSAYGYWTDMRLFCRQGICCLLYTSWEHGASLLSVLPAKPPPFSRGRSKILPLPMLSLIHIFRADWHHPLQGAHLRLGAGRRNRNQNTYLAAHRRGQNPNVKIRCHFHRNQPSGKNRGRGHCRA